MFVALWRWHDHSLTTERVKRGKTMEGLGGYFKYSDEREPNGFLHVCTTEDIIFIATLNGIGLGEER